MEGDKIVSVKGLESNLRPAPNQSIEYTIERNNGQIVIPIKSSNLPKDHVTMTRILGVMGILMLLIGIISFYQMGNTMSFILFLYCFTLAIHWGYFPQLISDSSQDLIKSIYSLLSMFMGSLILHFALIFPKGGTLSPKKYLFVYLPGIIGVLLFIATFFDQAVIAIFSYIEFILVTIYALVGYIIIIRNFNRTPVNDRVATGINLVFWGILIANIPYILSTFLPFMDFGGFIGIQPYSLFFLVEPVFFAFAIRKASTF